MVIGAGLLHQQLTPPSGQFMSGKPPHSRNEGRPNGEDHAEAKTRLNEVITIPRAFCRFRSDLSGAMALIANCAARFTQPVAISTGHKEIPAVDECICG
jgi:hypothetical protein